MSFIQNLFTSRDNNANSQTYVGQQDRLWWDPVTNQFYYSDGNTAGGFAVGGGSGGGSSIVNGTSSVSIPTANGNVIITINGIANTVAFSMGNTTFTGNLLPTTGNTYTLGTADQPWKSIYVSGNTVYIGNNALSSNGPNLFWNANQVTVSNASGAISANAVSASGNITASYFVGNGAALTGIVTSATGNVTGNLNVTGDASVVGNVTGNYFVGNGAALTGIVTSATGNITGNLNVTGAASVAGNVTASYFVGNGSALLSTMTDRGPDQNNWDTLSQMGVYTVNRVSWSGTVGAPLDSQVFVGLLEVKNSTNTAIEQVFYPGTVESGDVKIQWNRANWIGSWTPWIKIVNNDQIVTGGVY